jgi:glycosyltransferase involved in cell wall biosynthesis
MKPVFLMHDPLEIGHHLVYASAFTEWALAHGYEVYFSKNSNKDNSYERRYRNRTDVHIIRFDMPGETALSTGKHFFTEEGARAQIHHVKRLQEKLQPAVTLFSYADRMMTAWDRMLHEGESFSFSTYCLLLSSNVSDYTHTVDLFDEQFNRQLGERKLFKGIIILDEYQAVRLAQYSNIFWLPDIYRESICEQESLTNQEQDVLDQITSFLAESAPMTPLLMVGAFNVRKNVEWFFDLLIKHDDLCMVQAGQVLASYLRGDARMKHLITQKRLLAFDMFMSQTLLDAVMGLANFPFLLLPHKDHYGSSGLQLMAFHHGKPVLVPERGLMGRRTIDHGLGFTYKNDDQKDFERSVEIMLKTDPDVFKPALGTFMQNYSHQQLYKVMDRIFLNSACFSH